MQAEERKLWHEEVEWKEKEVRGILSKNREGLDHASAAEKAVLGIMESTQTYLEEIQGRVKGDEEKKMVLKAEALIGFIPLWKIG